MIVLSKKKEKIVRMVIKKKLTKEQHHICREKGTEQAFSGKYWNLKAF